MQQLILHPGFAEIVDESGQGEIMSGTSPTSYRASEPVDVDRYPAAVLIGNDVSLANAAGKLVDNLLSIAACAGTLLLHCSQEPLLSRVVLCIYTLSLLQQ